MINFLKSYLETLGIIFAFLFGAFFTLAMVFLLGNFLYINFGIVTAAIGLLIFVVLLLAAAITIVEMTTRI